MHGGTLLLYWLLFFGFALGSVGRLRTSPTIPRNAPLFYLAAIITVVIIGFRLKVGGDWTAYQIMFNSMQDRSLFDILDTNDPAYMLLNWLGAAIGADVWFTNTLCAVIFMWGLTRFANSQPDPWLVLLVAIPYLVIVVAMGYTRQAVAIGLMMSGLLSFKNGKYASFFFHIVLAAAFHKTVVAMIPIIILATSRHKIVIYSTSVIMIMMLFVVFVSGALSGMVNDYTTSGMKSDGAGVRIAMTIICASLFLIFQSRFSIDEEDRKIWRNFSYVSFLTLPALALMSSATIVDRISLYLIPLQLVVLSRLPLAFPRKGNQNGALLLLVLIYCAFIQFAWLNFASHAKLWLPYQSYLTQEM